MELRLAGQLSGGPREAGGINGADVAHRVCELRTLVFDRADNAAGVADGEDVAGDVAGDDAAGADHGAVADVDAGADDGSAADPNVGTDGDGFAEFRSAAQLCIQRMCRRVDLYGRA